jgi:beta-glucosidase
LLTLLPSGFPFGHGLSYTNFTYSDVTMSGRNVTFKLTNSGDVAGAEVCQVYASLPRAGLGADEPPQRLVAFEKVPLEPGASTIVSLALTDYSLSVWDDQVKHEFEVLKGEYQISVGSSSRDFHGKTSLTI